MTADLAYRPVWTDEATDITVRVLGPMAIEVGGREIRLAPITAAVLARLLVSHGELVTVDELFRDVWGGGTRAGTRREDRISVQKRVLELRRVLTGSADALLTHRGQVSAYQLMLSRDQVDMFRFEDLIQQAGRSDPATAVGMLTQALALWRGRPMFDVQGHDFVRRQAERLDGLRRFACRELIRLYRELGLPDQALAVAEQLQARDHHDPELAGEVSALRRLIRDRVGKQLRRSFADPKATVVVTPADLFAQDDAHLVAGFSDTFDTLADDDTAILVDRVYHGDRARLDHELRMGLRQVSRAAAESRKDKKRGKLIRYPIGTVVPLAQPGRRIFAVAYSTMGNDLIARSSLDDLGLSLDRLWDAVFLHGRLTPVAIPLIGSGLAGIDLPGHEDLLTLVIESFLRRSRHQRIAKELRVVISPSILDEIKLLEVAAYMRGLQLNQEDPLVRDPRGRPTPP